MSLALLWMIVAARSIAAGLHVLKISFARVAAEEKAAACDAVMRHPAWPHCSKALSAPRITRASGPSIWRVSWIEHMAAAENRKFIAVNASRSTVPTFIQARISSVHSLSSHCALVASSALSNWLPPDSFTPRLISENRFTAAPGSATRWGRTARASWRYTRCSRAVGAGVCA